MMNWHAWSKVMFRSMHALLANDDRAARVRDRRVGKQHYQHRLPRRFFDFLEALVRHKTHRPDAFAGILDGDDPREFHLVLGEEEIADLFDRRIDGPNARARSIPAGRNVPRRTRRCPPP